MDEVDEKEVDEVDEVDEKEVDEVDEKEVDEVDEVEVDGADLSEGAVGVAPAPRATDILLAVFTSETVGIVETDLDADFLIVSIFLA